MGSLGVGHRDCVCKLITVLIGLRLQGRIGKRLKKELENRTRKDLGGKEKQLSEFETSSKAKLELLEPV